MSVYVIATIEVKGGAMGRFTAALGEIIPIVAASGWTLVSAYALRTGQLGTVIDIWEMPDFNHLAIGLGAIAQNPRFPDIQAALQDSIIKETLSFADKLVYPATA